MCFDNCCCDGDGGIGVCCNLIGLYCKCFFGVVYLDLVGWNCCEVDVLFNKLVVLRFVDVECIYCVGFYVGNYLWWWYCDEFDVFVWIDFVCGELVM